MTNKKIQANNGKLLLGDALSVDHATGSVGIGTPSPGIEGNADFTYLTISRTTGSTPLSRLEMQGNRTSSGQLNSSIDGYVNGNLFTRIESSTGATATSGLMQFRTYTSSGGASIVGLKIEEGAVTLGPSGFHGTHQLNGSLYHTSAEGTATTGKAADKFYYSFRELGSSTTFLRLRPAANGQRCTAQITIANRSSQTNVGMYIVHARNSAGTTFAASNTVFGSASLGISTSGVNCDISVPASGPWDVIVEVFGFSASSHDLL